jgi:hypothetical protein
MKDEKESTAEVVQEENQTPKGRAAFLAMMQEKKPDYNPESDDQLFDDVHSMHSEMKGQLDKHKESNSKLAGLVAKDPKFGATLGMVAGEGKSFPYAVSKVYGKQPFELEGNDLEEFEKGYQEQLAALAESEELQAQASANFAKSQELISKICADNELDEAQSAEIYNDIMDYADDLLMGNIKESLITEIIKGKNYDQDVQDAAEAGKVEGLNQKIDAKLKKPEAAMPDMGTKTTGGAKKMPIPEKKSFYSPIKG